METGRYKTIYAGKIEVLWKQEKIIGDEKAESIEKIWQEAVKKKKLYNRTTWLFIQK